MYRLVVTEKPSVAMSIAAALGVKDRKDGYMEGCGSPAATSKRQGRLEALTEPTGETGWLISWCVGHLAELSDAAAYDPKYAKWRREDLPILPENWRFTIGKDKRGQFDTLRELLRREDVSEVVNACNAGREGELIFRTVYHLAGCTKPVKRLWISSMEDAAIREGFANLRTGSDYDGLHQAALCRSKADWLVGINATRLFSVIYGRTLNIGRVVSPTLALIVQREAEIAAFEPVPFYTVELNCGSMTLAGERISSKEDAGAIAASCEDSTAAIQMVERREKSEKAPALYDLTILQREANRVLSFTAQQTLDYLQALYEKSCVLIPGRTAAFSRTIWRIRSLIWSPPPLPSAAWICRERFCPPRCAAARKSRTTMPLSLPGARHLPTSPPCPWGSGKSCGWFLWLCSGPSARPAAVPKPQ